VTDKNILFACQQCGFCCQGETTVSLDDDDVKRLVAFLGVSRTEAEKKYLRITGNVVQMKTVDGHCIFYENGCTIHSAKSWRCKQWPLHPSILTDPANFETIRNSCPGINNELTYEEFCRHLVPFLEQERNCD